MLRLHARSALRAMEGSNFHDGRLRRARRLAAWPTDGSLDQLTSLGRMALQGGTSTVLPCPQLLHVDPEGSSVLAGDEWSSAASPV